MGLSWELDDDDLARELEALVTIFVGGSTSLADDHDHVEWLSARRHEIDWRFWNRYRRWIGDVSGLPPQAVQRLDEITDDVLRRLEDAPRPGAWDRRGMVVGQVQSGKTANYTGLICKAADAGYKLIVVLAGLHNSLRSQTQLRLDEGFLGFDTQQARMYDQTNRRMGVGSLPGERLLAVNSMTNSEENGRLQPSRRAPGRHAHRLGPRPARRQEEQVDPHQPDRVGHHAAPGGAPRDRPPDRAEHSASRHRRRGRQRVGQHHGRARSARTACPDPEINPTAINGLIRQLLHSFEKSAYVGYTATPFANIFIDEQAEQEPYGEDLFPRSFIIRLPEPTNYIGPAQVFGIRADATAGLEARPGLPIVREVDDSDAWIRPRHKRTDPVGPRMPRLAARGDPRVRPQSARRARARGQTAQHNSMLVHVTQLVDVQEVVEQQISAEVARLRDRLRYGDGDSRPTLIDELRLLWERDFEADDPSLRRPGTAPPALRGRRAAPRRGRGTDRDAADQRIGPRRARLLRPPRRACRSSPSAATSSRAD